MMVLKNKWKNRFILILFMVGFVFFACKEETDLYFNGDITVIKSFDNDTLLSPVKVDVGVNLAVSFSCIVGCPICKIYLVDHGYRNFKEKIHFME